VSYIYKIPVLAISIFVSNSACAKDINILNNPLLQTEVSTPDYTLVIEGHNPSYTDSETAIKHNAVLKTLSSRASTSGFPSANLNVIDILQPNTKFTVKKVLYNKPSFPKSLFSSGHNLAVLESKGKQYTVAPVTNFENKWSISFELNDCKKMRSCNNWRNAIKHCLNKINPQYCYIHYNLYIKDEKSLIVWDKNVRPPYKKSWVNSSITAFEKYAKQNNLDVIIDKNHLTVSAKLTVLELTRSCNLKN
jgi:hypothetical protein